MSWMKCWLYGSKVATWSKNDSGSANAHAPNTRKTAAPMPPAHRTTGTLTTTTVRGVARLHYAAICSLDGYVADEAGNFDWSAPDEEVHEFVNDLQRPVGTYLLGRRMYEVLLAWETM